MSTRRAVRDFVRARLLGRSELSRYRNDRCCSGTTVAREFTLISKEACWSRR
jgi:hypothetical protein